LNLELSVMAMLTAEIIAVPYYKALHDATNSPLLRQICRQLLRDEMQHLRFQLAALSKLDERHSPIGAALARLAHRILFAGTILIVWQQHHTVLTAGQSSFRKFWQSNWQYFNHLFEKRRAAYQKITP